MTHQSDERGDPLTRTHDPRRKVYPARQARQGFLGRPVLAVLVISLVLAFLVWGALELWGDRLAPSEPRPSASTSSETTLPGDTFDDTAPAGSNPAVTDRDPTPETGTGGASQRRTPDGTAQ